MCVDPAVGRLDRHGDCAQGPLRGAATERTRGGARRGHGADPRRRAALRGVAAVACDLFDLLLFDLAVRAGWPGFADVSGYQAFDKWADQVYLAAYLVVALRDFPPGPRLVAVVLWLLFAGSLALGAGLLPRAGLLLVPKVFEPWFLAVAFTLRYRPAFVWTRAGGAVVLGGLSAAKFAQEWLLHVGRPFDSTTLLGALGATWEAMTAPFR